MRKALAVGIRRLGISEERELGFLEKLSRDKERSVRAAAGEAIAEFSTEGALSGGSPAELITDDDPYVRISVLRGANRAAAPSVLEKTSFFTRLLDDPDGSVRLKAVDCISSLEHIPEIPGLSRNSPLSSATGPRRFATPW